MKRLTQPFVLSLALAGLTVLLFLPTAGHDFVRYDDQLYVTENSHVRPGLSRATMGWAFTTTRSGNWHPLTWLSHAMDCQLYGLRPGGHHRTSVLLHTFCVALLFGVLHRMTGALWRSAMVALLFGVHPAHVESVAWVAERKDVLSALFWMLTLWAYTGHVEKLREGAAANAPWRGTARYGLALVFFSLGLMAKPMLVSLPLVLLLLDYWPLQRVDDRSAFWRLFREKIPFFALSLASGTVTLWAQHRTRNLPSLSELSLSQRLVHTPIAYLHYVAMLAWPQHLAVFYPYPSSESWLAALLALGVLFAISAFAVFYARRAPYFVVGWGWFLVTLMPVIGLAQVGDQAWADRYTYLPSIGLFIAVVWGVAALTESRPFFRWAAVPVMAVLAGAAYVQLSYWRDTRSLFEHAAEATSGNALAYAILASVDLAEGKIPQGEQHCAEALRAQPGLPEALCVLGEIRDQQGRRDDAIAAYIVAVKNNAYLDEPRFRLGADLLKRGDFPAAVVQLRTVVTNDAEFAPAHNDLGVALLQSARAAEGAAELREALRLDPTNAQTAYNLALSLNQLGQWAEAVRLLVPLAEAQPGNPMTQCQCAEALAHTGDMRGAMSRYAAALLLTQDFPEALNGLAWILATDPRPEIRNDAQALAMARRACDLTHQQDARMLITLAAACAENGSFGEASAVARKAEDLAATQRKGEELNLAKDALAKFDAHQPYRQKFDRGL